jgi:cupin superfamily acireductone dioxygenase involved in methionine salvage
MDIEKTLKELKEIAEELNDLELSYSIERTEKRLKILDNYEEKAEEVNNLIDFFAERYGIECEQINLIEENFNQELYKNKRTKMKR